MLTTSACSKWHSQGTNWGVNFQVYKCNSRWHLLQIYRVKDISVNNGYRLCFVYICVMNVINNWKTHAVVMCFSDCMLYWYFKMWMGVIYYVSTYVICVYWADSFGTYKGSWVSLVARASDSQSEKNRFESVLWHFIILASSVDRSCKWWSRWPKLTSSVISNVKSIIYIYIFLEKICRCNNDQSAMRYPQIWTKLYHEGKVRKVNHQCMLHDMSQYIISWSKGAEVDGQNTLRVQVLPG